MFSWIRLDNAASIFPSITNTSNTYVFRVQCYLKHRVDVEILNLVIPKVIKRFPSFQVYMKKGLFWYYFEKTDKIPKLSQEQSSPCQYINMNNNFLFRIIPYHNRIAIESTHSLTDGFGVTAFLKTLVIEYLKKVKNIDKSYPFNFSVDTEINRNELKDEFLKFRNITKENPPKKEATFKLPFSNSEGAKYKIVNAVVSVEKLKQASKKYKASINDYLVASIIYAYQEVYKASSKKMKKKISCSVAVNLRNLFPCMTLRNFSYVVDPFINPKLGYYDFEEIIYRVHHYIKLETTIKQMLPHLKRNINSQKNIFVRLIPLFIKTFVLKMSYSKVGDSPISTSFSNLGRFSVPEEFEDDIDYVEAIASPSKVIKFLGAGYSYKDKFCITFTKRFKENDVEKIFFKKLLKDGIDSKVNTNW